MIVDGRTEDGMTNDDPVTNDCRETGAQITNGRTAAANDQKQRHRKGNLDSMLV